MKPHIGVAGLALMGATLVACGGGSSVPTPPTAPSSAPTFSYKSASLSTSGTTPVQLSFGGSSATVTFPAVSGNSTAGVFLETSLPDGTIAPQARTIAAKSRISNAIGASNLTALDYVLVTVNSSVSMASSPAFSFTSGSPISGSAYIAVLDMKNVSAGWNVLLGPGTVNGSTVSFTSQVLAPPFVLAANDTYVFALVTSGSTITPPPPTIAPNAAAVYSGTKSVNYRYGFGYSYPPASATAPPTTLNYSVSANVSVGSSPFPGTATAHTIDERVSESDASNLSTTMFTTDSWVSIASVNNAYNEVLYGQLQQEPTSANLPVTQTTYGTPQIIDELPETNNATWSNGPAANIAYNYASGDSGTRTVNNDGTYVDKEQMGPSQGGAFVTMTENADGSGSINGPIEGGFITNIGVSAPSSAAPSTITITESIGAPYQQPPYGYPPTLTKHDALWYTQPAVFYNESNTVHTGVALPSGCTPNPYSTTNEVVRKITSLDTVIGDLETTEFDSYNVDGFPVCMVTNDVLSFAYGQQGTTPSIFAVGPLGLEVVTTNETLVIQNTPPSTAAAARTAQAVHPSSFIAALQAHQLNAFQRERVVRKRAFFNHINGGQQ